MPKFMVTRKRMVTQEASVEITTKDGELPLDKALALADSKWKWANISEMPMSPEVSPIEEPVEESASAPVVATEENANGAA